MRIDLNADWTGIEAVDVVAANLPAIDEPTNGFVLDGQFIFVARSQWSDFSTDGDLQPSDPMPALIVSLRLE